MAATSAPSITDRWAMERDPSVPAEMLTKSGRIRRTLFNGESLTNAEALERLGVGRSDFYQAVAQLRLLGFEFLIEPPRAGDASSAKRMRLADPHFQPTPEQLAAFRTKNNTRPRGQKRGQGSQAESKSAPRTAEPMSIAKKRKPAPMPHLPTIGAQLLVTGIAWDPDFGVAQLGLRNGAVAYTVRIEGQTLIDVEGHED